MGKVHAREFIDVKLNEITDTREFTRGKLQENLFGTSLAEKIYLMQENLLWRKLYEITDTREFIREKFSRENLFEAIKFIVEKLI